MKIGALIVAAGLSSRMKDFKPMMQLGSDSLIQKVVTTLLQAGADPILVVTGKNHEMLEKHLSDFSVDFIYNANYENTQMFDSAKLGMEYLYGRCDRFFFTPADIPLVTLSTVNQLLESKALIAKPVYGDKGGHPLLIDRSLIPKILEYDGDCGMKGALINTGVTIERIEVEDEGILLDADTWEDYEMLIEYESNSLS